MPTHVASPPGSFVTSDLAARRIVALVRVLAAFVLAVLTSIETVTVDPWYTWVLGVVWLPLASWLWFVEEGPVSRMRWRVGYAGDVVMTLLTMVALPDHADLVATAALPAGALIAYRSGPRPGIGMVAAFVGLRVGVDVAGLTPPTDVLALCTNAAVALALVLLVTRATAVQRRDHMSAQHFAERSDLILSRSSEAIVVTDAAGAILQTNPAARSSLMDGELSADGVGHCSDLGLLGPDGPLNCAAGCALAVLCHDGQDVEVHREVGDEMPRPFLANASRLPGAVGEGAEYVHSFRDITRLRQADEAKTLFLATASHELKTPLTVIRGFTQILRATVLDDDSQVALEAIDSRSAELVNIVDRLLLSSRIEAGRVELEPDLVDITALLTERSLTLGNSIGREITLDCARDLSAIASSDALATAVEHLLDNAAKYSPDGGAIHLRAWQDPAGDVRIAIADTGIGMSAEQAAHCFEKFWQAEATDVRRFGGTGIGLYIVHSLVTGMGGRIAVASRPGEGTTFTITLPATPEGLPPEQDDAPADADAAPDRSSVDEFMTHLGLQTGAQV